MTLWSKSSFSALAILVAATPSGEARAESSSATSIPTGSPKVAEAFRASAPAAKTTVGPDKWPAAVKAIFVGVSGGPGFASVTHPQLGSTKVLGPLISFQAGYRVSERWAVSIVYTDFQQRVTRNNGSELFGTTTSWLHTATKCDECKLPGGGSVFDTTFRLATIGPSVDVTPFGRNGPFIGASGGVAMATLLGTTIGGSGTARAGLRLRPLDNISLGVEGGIQGQAFSGGSARIGYGAAEVRLSF